MFPPTVFKPASYKPNFVRYAVIPPPSCVCSGWNYANNNPPPQDSRCAFLIHSFMSLPYGGFKKIAPPSASLDQSITKASRLEVSGWFGPNHLSHKAEFSNAAASKTKPNSLCNLAYRSLGVVHLSLLDVSAAAPATKKLLTGSIPEMVTSR